MPYIGKPNDKPAMIEWNAFDKGKAGVVSVCLPAAEATTANDRKETAFGWSFSSEWPGGAGSKVRGYEERTNMRYGAATLAH